MTIATSDITIAECKWVGSSGGRNASKSTKHIATMRYVKETIGKDGVSSFKTFGVV